MHESSLLRGVLQKIQELATANNAKRVVQVKLRLGELNAISADHLREHFVLAAAGTVAEGADVVIERVDDLTDPAAQHVMLDGIEIES